MKPKAPVPGLIGHTFVELPEVDSTNNYAMRQVSEREVTEGTVYFALEQTAGKGQRGKAWYAEPGGSILLSIVLRPAMLRLGDQFLLSAAIALGTLDFFTKYAGEECRIKWSNDIYWSDRKAGGMLIENVLRGNDWQYAIAGIGLNINTPAFPEHLPNPVSLRQITGRSWEVKTLARDLCGCIGKRYLGLRPDKSGYLMADYKRALYRFGIPALYRSRELGMFTATITDVTADGKLVMEREGERLLFDFGEVEFIIR